MSPDDTSFSDLAFQVAALAGRLAVLAQRVEALEIALAHAGATLRRRRPQLRRGRR